MTQREYKQIAKVLAEELRKNHQRCPLGFNPEELSEERKFVQQLMKIADRYENMKWGIFGKTLYTIIIGALSLLLFGVVMYLRGGGLKWLTDI